MIRRRTLLVAAACYAAARPARAALPVPAGNRMAFSIVRKGGAIGTQVLTFEPDGNRLTVHIAVDIAVTLGPIVLYRYRHRATERWEDGRVTGLDSETNDGGTKDHAKMWWDGESLIVEGSGGPRYVAPPDASPATHWNRKMLDGPMINTQQGKLLRTTVERLGMDNGPSGGSALADHFALRGDVDMDTWYTPAPRWVGLRFTGRDGVEIRYEPIG